MKSKNTNRILGFRVAILLDELNAMKEKFGDKKESIEQIEGLVKGLKNNGQ